MAILSFLELCTPRGCCRTQMSSSPGLLICGGGDLCQEKAFYQNSVEGVVNNIMAIGIFEGL